MRFSTLSSSLWLLAASLNSAAAQKAHTLVTGAEYSQFERYAEFSISAYFPTCSKPPFGSKVLNYLNIALTDTQATVFRDDTAKEIVVAFRGTSDMNDDITDLAFIPLLTKPNGQPCLLCAAHTGFYLAFESIQSSVESSLQAALAANPTYSVVITGHSLGGALAYLAFYYLKPFAQYKVRAGYTFGQLRVGNQQFAAAFDEISGNTATSGTFFRVTHFDDGFPRVPPTSLGYQHSLTEFWESNSVATQSTTFRCYGQEPADCINSEPGEDWYAAHMSYAGLTYNCNP